MDDKWFKLQQKKAGVTADEIAAKLGRDRSVVSRIYTGRQRMSLDWAKAFAEVLDQPIAEVLKRAGVADEPTAQQLTPGFSDSDATVWKPQRDADPAQQIARILGDGRGGVDTWQVKSGALALQGYLPGDLMLVDSHQSELCKAGDVVIAQIYNWNSGDAKTVLRRFEPPVLVAASADPEDHRVHVVDGNNVVIRGKVVASWRA